MTNLNDATSTILKDARNLLLFHREIGIDSYHLTPELASFLDSAKEKDHTSPEQIDARKIPSLPKTLAAATKNDAAPKTDLATIVEIKQEIDRCTRCRLHEKRRTIVFGEGDNKAGLLIIADHPGPDEDQTGRPFQGEAGELFDKMIGAIGLKREEVYLTSMVKCCPFEQPLQEAEIKTCLPFLLRQITSISPTVICAMGLKTAQTLTKNNKDIFKLRGRFYDFNGIPVMPTFHPQLLLKNGELKKATWLDLQMIQQKLAL
ncbi:MAG: uracil-DNA glycosylase [Proteobacteria bacterium]|nr:uracil-DNA glycosylase [Pseudomonadota bacterium]MBU1717381.1 uracil-DNA glycosylase [Pseudomonadota bacterium]